MLEYEYKVTFQIQCSEAELVTMLKEFAFGVDIHSMWVHAFIESNKYTMMVHRCKIWICLTIWQKERTVYRAKMRRFFVAVTKEKVYQIRI